MSTRPRTAFITGGSSGFGRALSERLLEHGYHIFIADLNLTGAQELAASHNSPTTTKVHFSQTDVASWSSQLAAFQQALHALGGRIDFVAPIAGIGESKWIPFAAESIAAAPGEFVEPDLKVLDVDFTGVLYTVALAVQQFRRQEKGESGWRGKLGLVASVCGLYDTPSMPLYSSAKHGVASFARMYGRLLRDEGITVNCVCPGIAPTGIGPEVFFKGAEEVGVLTSSRVVVDAFVDMLEGSGSGELYVCGPEGWAKKEEEKLEGWLEKTFEYLNKCGMGNHYDKKQTAN